MPTNAVWIGFQRRGYSIKLLAQSVNRRFPDVYFKLGVYLPGRGHEDCTITHLVSTPSRKVVAPKVIYTLFTCRIR